MTSALLLIAALAHLGPEAFAQWFGGSVKAWAYVGYGIEATALWLLAACVVAQNFKSGRLGLLAVCAYGVWESVQRPVCRLMLPLDVAPIGGNVCDLAGINTAAFSPFAIAMVAVVISYTSRCKD